MTNQSVRRIVRPFGAVACVYAGLGVLGVQDAALRRRHLAEALRADGAPDEVIAVVTGRLAAAGEAPTVLALFVDGDGTVLYEGRLSGVEMPDQASYSAPAQVVPLLAWAQNHPPYLLAVVDRAGAELTASLGGGSPARTWSVTGPDDEIRRNAPGGWAGLAQPRYQHRAEDSWKHNAGRVAEQITAHGAHVGTQVLVLSGDVRALQFLSEQLPDEPGLLIRHLAGSRAQDGSQTHRGRQLEQALRDAAVTQTRLLLDQFQAHLEPGGRAVQGVRATVDALAADRVATLLVADPGPSEQTVWFGPGPTDIYLDHEAAQFPGQPVRVGPLVDSAVRAALLADARVRIVPSGTAGSPLEGIGAICRYAAR